MRGANELRSTGAILLRVVADALMTNVALGAALALRFFLTFVMGGHGGPVDYDERFWEYVAAYCHNAAFITAVCLIVFALSGFYTYSRGYQGRYKALVITQAVLLSYLLVSFFTYLVSGRLQFEEMPRGAMVLACVIHLALAVASRTWTFLWERVIRPEREARLRDIEGPPARVLVIGGAGYIGSALLPKLLKNGRRVRVLDMLLYGRDPIRHLANHPRLEIVKGDFRQVEEVVHAMRGMEAVVHLGAIVGDPACSLDEQVTVDVNLSATQMIAQVAKASRIRRFVFASTCSVYGASDETLDERSEVRPISLYGATKLAAERGLRAMACRAFAPTILRFATVYGLSGRTRFDLVVNLLAAKARIDGKITVHGGDQWRPFVHVDDAASAVALVLDAPLSIVGNEIFNVGSDSQNYTIQQVAELIHEHVFTADLIIEDGNTDKRNYRVRFQKIRDRLDFQCRWSVEDGIRQVLDAIASGEVLDYRDRRYSNVKFLSDGGGIEMVRVDGSWMGELRRAYAVAQHEA
jgi:nucleoside-diphosphate-sugar epimerase